MSDVAISLSTGRRLAPPLGLGTTLVLAYGIVPLFGTEYLFDAILTPFLALSLAALGLNILAGYAGQISLGSSSFMAIGAYAAYNLMLRVPALPMLLDLVLAGAITAAGGFYLAVSTLAAQFFVPWVLNKFGWFSNNDPSGVISTPAPSIGPVVFDTSRGRYLFCLVVVTAALLLAWRLVGSRTGRNFIAIRDHETAARIVGIPVLRTKLIAFAASSFIIGIAGVLWAFAYLRTVEPNGFDLDRSFQILFIVILGGLASLRGAFLGAALMVTFPLLLARAGQAALGTVFDSGMLEMSQRILIGLLIIVFLIYEPAGLAALLDRLRFRSARA
ncbi:MAG: branched-chain amino acid ABC transporter permease [Rhodospirillales bacterium]